MELYAVVLSGFARGPEYFRSRMMKQGMKVAQIERVIESVPCVLKKGLSLDEARRYEQLFRDAGGAVQVKPDGGGGDEDITKDRKPNPRPPGASLDAPRASDSKPRLEPLPPPLQAPPEPEAPGPPLLELESAADSAATAFAPPVAAFAATSAGAIEPPASGAYDPSVATLDLVDGPPPPGPGEVASGFPAVPAEAVPVGPPGVRAVQAAPLATGKPPAEFKHHNPWIFRGIWIGLAVIFSTVVMSCVSKYKVGERIHDFSQMVDDEMSNDLLGLSRQVGGPVGEQELYRLVDSYARRAHVRVRIHHLQEGFAEIAEAPGGQGCMAQPPGTIFEQMPHDKRMQWLLKVRNCTAPPWIVGFSVSITARVGLSKDTVTVEQWVFLADWLPSS